MAKYSGIHRRQLFHWIGRHIEKTLDKGRKLKDIHREKYLECLKESLHKGLRVGLPEDTDGLLDCQDIRIECPVVCFTEWSVAESMPHTQRYGRLGLGFPKKFVVGKKGRPVTYLSATTSDPATKSMLALAEHFSDSVDPKLKAHWLQVSQYLKPFRPWRNNPPPAAAHKRTQTHKTKKNKPVLAKAKRSYGSVMQYLEEREWRIAKLGKQKYFVEDDRGVDMYHLPITPGKDLFTLVLPDHETYSMLIKDEFFINKLMSKDTPPVTIITLDDLNTM